MSHQIAVVLGDQPARPIDAGGDDPLRQLVEDVFVSLAVAFAVATVIFGATLPFPYALVWLALAPLIVGCFRVELAELLADIRIAWGQQSKTRNTT